MLGPVYWWDVTRLSRYARFFAARVGYALGQSGAVLFAFMLAQLEASLRSCSTGRKIDPFPIFVTYLAPTLAFTQLLAVLLVAPAVFAATVTIEREKRTLEALLLTRLTLPEILIEKYLARLTQVFGLILVGVPMIAIASTLGGISLREILLMTASAGLTAIWVGALSTLVSARAASTRKAVVSCYFLIASITGGVEIIRLWLEQVGSATEQAIGLIIHPFAFWILAYTGAQPTSSIPLTSLLGYHATFYLGLSAVSLMLAILRARRLSEGSKRARWLKRATQQMSARLRPPVWSRWPMVWKDLFVAHRHELGVIPAVTSIFGIATWLGWMVWWVDSWQPTSTDALSAADVALGVGWGISCLLVMVRSATAIGYERDRGTWGCLLATPRSHGEILFAKYVSSLSPTLIVSVILMCAGALFVSAGWPWAAFLYPVGVIVVYNVFVAAVGLICSTWFTSTGRALVVALGISIVALVFAPFYLSLYGSHESAFGCVLEACNPLDVVQSAMRYSFDQVSIGPRFPYGLISLAGYAISAVAIALATWVLFPRLTGRMGR